MLLILVTVLLTILTAIMYFRKDRSTATRHNKRHSETSCPSCFKDDNNFIPPVRDDASPFLVDTVNTPSGKHGYMAVLNYVGQQGSGLQALVSLQCTISSFDLPVRIPEPLLVNSRFYTFTSDDKVKDKKRIKFSDVFDIEHFNEVSQSLGYPFMESRENFLAFAPRDVVFVDVKSVSEFAPRNQQAIKVVWPSNDSADNDGLEKEIRTLEKVQQKLGIEGSKFTVVKILEVTTYSDELHSYIMSENEFREDILGNLALDNVTIIFSTWRTLWHIVNHHSRNPHKCLGVGYSSDKDQFYPSQRLLSDADRYESMFLSSGYNVAVMFRIERLLLFIQALGENNEKWTMNKCLDEAIRTTQRVQRNAKPMITLDLGKFASSSWSERNRNIIAMTEKVVPKISSLFNGEWNIKDWEKSFIKAAGGVEDKGYIAALQRTLASRADCLVMIGGGSFQDLAMKNYIRNHPNLEDQCIHSVCTMAVEYVFKRLRNARA